MSNSQVGTVYSAIIDKVCESSQVDFEEGGVDQRTLEEMKTTWQKKLSMLGVAQFPWDPPPQPPQPAVLQQPTTVPSNAPRPQPTQSVQNPTPTTTAPISSSAIPVTQANLDSGAPPPIAPVNGMAPSTAQQRAAANLQQRYGAAAQTQINQLSHQNVAIGHRPQAPQNQQLHPQVQGVPQSHGHLPPQQRPSAPPGQTDGAQDEVEDPLQMWKEEVARRRADMAKNSGQGDRLLRERMLEVQSRMEGGGLMLPLEEHRRPFGGKDRKVITYNAETRVTPQTTGADTIESSKELTRTQYDGAGDEDDEDAINSDLDDPDELDGGGEEEDEGAAGNVMLCTYEKVQRVKNKWKCTLKDGTLWTGGKEYVFHKGQGEFEW